MNVLKRSPPQVNDNLQKNSISSKFFQMLAAKRQTEIEHYLSEVECASLEELSQRLGASVSTIRRDLNHLETLGRLERTHGGARLLQVAPRLDEFAFALRDARQREEKEAIARAAARFIHSDQTVFVDAGSTTYHVARQLETKPIHILTNSLPVAQHYSGSSQVEVVVSGGVIYPRLGVLVGHMAVEAFAKMHADVAVMGAGGLTLEGVSNSHVLLIDIQRAMLRQARKILLCLDHTKLGKRSVTPLCGLDRVDILVTDHKAPRPILEKIKAMGVEVVVAEP